MYITTKYVGACRNIAGAYEDKGDKMLKSQIIKIFMVLLGLLALLHVLLWALEIRVNGF